MSSTVAPSHPWVTASDRVKGRSGMYGKFESSLKASIRTDNASTAAEEMTGAAIVSRCE